MPIPGWICAKRKTRIMAEIFCRNSICTGISRVASAGNCVENRNVHMRTPAVMRMWALLILGLRCMKAICTGQESIEVIFPAQTDICGV